ncbi:MAG: hypothetical protein ACI9YE_003804 [Psychroserpens sp.]|jgi:hypothetical protein
MKYFERTFSLAAAVITIVNFIIIFPLGLSDSWFPAEFIISMEVPTKLVLVTILELSLAYAFGRAFALSSKLDDLHRFLIYMIVAFCSAWLSVFNLESLLMGKVASGFLEHLGLVGMIVVAWIVAATMIEGHINSAFPESATLERNKTESKITEAILVQATAYIFIFLSLLAR